MTPTAAPPELEPLGQSDVADLLKVKPATVRVWNDRGIFPEPDFVLSGRHTGWYRSTIESWAKTTGRWPGNGTPATWPDEVLVTVTEDHRRLDPDGRRLCDLVGCFEPHRARGRCRGHYHEATGK